MKHSSRDYQLGLASPLNYAAIQNGNIKSSSKKEAGLDVNQHALVSREGRGREFFLDIPFHRMCVIESRVENRRSGFSLPVAADEAFASSPQSGWAWLCFLFPLVEPDRQISRIRLSEKTHEDSCDAVYSF